MSVDGKSIAALRFSEVSSLLSGPEGVPISLGFERMVREGAESHTRTYDVSLKRERFFLGEVEEEDDEDDDVSLISESGDGGLRKRKADYWQGYRAAMAQKAPPFDQQLAGKQLEVLWKYLMPDGTVARS